MFFVYWGPAIAYAALIFSLSQMSHPPGAEAAPDYVLHFLEYGLFALTVLWGMTRGLKRRFSFRIGLNSWAIVTAYGILDEVHQFFIPERSSSIHDVLADTLGAAVFLAACYFVLKSGKAKRRAPSS